MKGAAILDGGAMSSRLRELDFLRGLAILGVIMVHVGIKFSSGSSIFDSWAAFGRFGVQLFYFVSSLTMCFMWEARKQEVGRVRKFYIRRFFRIAPLFWLAIPFYLLVYGVGERYWAPEGIGVRQVILTALFLHGFWPDTINSVVPGGWSIAVEMTFYLLFPLLVLCVGSRKFAYLFLSMLVWFLYSAFIRPALAGVLGDSELVRDFLFLNFVSQAPVFLLGCYFYYAIKNGGGWVDVVIVVLWCLFGFVMEELSVIESSEFLYIYVVMGGCVYFCMRLGVKMALLERLGKRSYAMYLSHFVVLSIVARLMPQLEGFAVFFLVFAMVSLVAYLVAGLLGWLIEDRVQTWISQRLRVTARQFVGSTESKA
ncbi:acyltransferase family protein [Metapseudomonas otitidis]|uniref:acyltransferase family protein n=1 Tax=Metapseudomonas otitidis TaxID=319939 RepID=UPI0013F632EA|nr:acyltransferase [Pseudomonas otitidis]